MRRWILIFALIMSIFCTSNRVMAEESQDKWLIYWYICGANLESGNDSSVANAGDITRVHKNLKSSTESFKEFVDQMINTIDDEDDPNKSQRNALKEYQKLTVDLDVASDELGIALDNFKDIVRDPNKSLAERNIVVDDLDKAIYKVDDAFNVIDLNAKTVDTVFNALPEKYGVAKDDFNAVFGEVAYYVMATTSGGNASTDIKELMKSELSPNVKFVIQTGGATRWRNEKVPNDTIGRYTYDSNGWHYQGSFVDVDMGDQKTLVDFLKYGKENIEPDFKPNHRMFIFWNHGGFVGLCYDERYKNPLYPDLEPEKDSYISIDELYQSFHEVFPNASANNPPFEIIGLDVCFGATYENLNNLYGLTNYVVASEDREDQVGWYYADWIKSLSENPSMNGRSLGRIICDTSYGFLRDSDRESLLKSANDATFAVIDLSQWADFRNSYETFGKSLLKLTQKDENFYGKLDIASSKKNYVFELTRLTDLKTFSQEIKGQLPSFKSSKISESDKKRLVESIDTLSDSLDSVVLYKSTRGKNQEDSNGIAIYYPVTGENQPFNLAQQKETFQLYNKQKTAPKFTKQLVEGKINLVESGVANNNSSVDESNSELESDSNLESETKSRSKSGSRSRSKSENQNQQNATESQTDLGLMLINDGMSYRDLENISYEEFNPEDFEISIQLTQDQLNSLSQISCMFGSEDVEIIEDSDQFDSIYLGSVQVNKRDNGQFFVNPKASWLSIDGHRLCSFVTNSTPDELDSSGNVIKWGYTSYTIPILRNNVLSTLNISYNHETKQYIITSISDNSKKPRARASARDYDTISRADKITPVFLAVTKNNEIKFVKGVETFNLTSISKIYEVPLPYGNCFCVFYVYDIHQKPSIASEGTGVIFKVNFDGKIEQMNYFISDIEEKDLSDENRDLEYDNRIQAEKERRMNLEQKRSSKKRNRSK